MKTLLYSDILGHIVIARKHSYKPSITFWKVLPIKVLS